VIEPFINESINGLVPELRATVSARVSADGLVAVLAVNPGRWTGKFWCRGTACVRLFVAALMYRQVIYKVIYDKRKYSVNSID
jgi:hypothetical protein